MYNSEFEKQVQEKMEGLKMTPSDNLWNRIESELPGKSRRRNKIALLLLLLLGGCGLVWMMSQVYHKQPGSLPASEKIQQVDSAGNSNNIITAQQQTDKKDSSSQLNNTQKNDAAQLYSDNKKTGLTASGTEKPVGVNMMKAGDNTATQINTKSTPGLRRLTGTLSADINDTKDDVVGSKPLQKRAVVNKLSTKITVVQQPAINEESTLPAAAGTLTAAEPFTANTIHGQSAAINKILRPRKKLAEPIAAVSSFAKSDNGIAKKKWQFGFTLSGGLSKQVSNPLYFSSNGGQAALFGIGGPLPTADSSGNGQVNATSSKAFSAGFYMHRPVNKRWSIQAGLSYSYLSYKSVVGQRIDSTARYYVNGIGLYSDNYFQPVSFINVSQVYLTQNYVNRVHLLQLPFEAQYNFGKKRQWSILGGVTAAYLLGSNALVYKPSPPAYISSSEAYNKLLLSMHTGISYTNNKGYPFSAGIRFSYGANSFVKKSINNQHLVSSQLFLNIPFKK
jgi:Outer membrane protein beta-barrel domain